MPQVGVNLLISRELLSVGEDSQALEAQGNAELPIQIQLYFRFIVHVINSFSRAWG